MATRNKNVSIVKFLANTLTEECGEYRGWLEPIWRLLSKEFKKQEMHSTMGTSDYFKCEDYSDLSAEDYAAMVEHMPADMNNFIGHCMLKLRETIIAENLNRTNEPWTIYLQPHDNEETNILAYFLSVIYFVLTTNRNSNDDECIMPFVRAFNLLTMLMRHWRTSLPSPCIESTVDADAQTTIIPKYVGESGLPEGYNAIQNLFIYTIYWMEDQPTHLKLLTNDVLYDISVIVRMPVTFTLGIYIARLCSAIASLSEIPIGDSIGFCDVKSTKIDLAFSWIYHMILNTPPILNETLCDNVGAALTIFGDLFHDNTELTPAKNSANRENVANFVINIKEHIMNSHWFEKAFASLGYNYSHYKEFSKILVTLPRSISWGVIRTMINNNKYVAQAPEVCGNCLILVNSTSTQSLCEEEIEETRRFKSQLLYFTLCPFVNDRNRAASQYFPNVDAAVLPRLLQVVYNLASQPGRQFYKDLTNIVIDDAIVTHLLRDPVNIANMLSNHISMNWRHGSANQLIINIWCKLVVSTDVVRPRDFKSVVVLIEKSSASDLHPCVDNIKCLIPYIALGGLNENIVIRIMNTLLRHALNPGSMSHAYVRVLYHAIFDGDMALQRRRVAYHVVSCICSNNSSTRLFQMFRELRLLTNANVTTIVNVYVTHDEPVAWKLMHRSLQVAEYTDIPQYMYNMLRAFLQIDVLCTDFTADIQLAFFGSLLSIIRYRRARHLIGRGDSEFFKLLNTFLRKCFQTSHCTSEVQFVFLELVTELRAFLPSTDQWVLPAFQKTQDAIMQYLSPDNYYETTATRVALFREIARTCGDMALRLNLPPNGQLVQLIARRIKDTRARDIPLTMQVCYTMNWSTLALLFGKICLREPQFVTTYIDAMHHILKKGTESQKSMIIEAMSDICTIHIENIGIIMPFLMEYLARRSYLQVSACQSLLNLLNSGNVRLQRTEYLLLVSLIATEEPSLRAVFMKLFEENLLPNNSDLILTHFVPMILYFHEVYNHPDYAFSTYEMAELHVIPGILENRCSIYATLLKYVTTSDKFQLMLKIATDIVCVLHRRRLPHSAGAVRMLPDAYKVIYIVTKTIDDKCDTPNAAIEMYKETFTLMESMERTSAYLFMNYDGKIKDILVILLAMLEDIHTVHASMFQDTFHLIMFVISTFFANVSSLVIGATDTSFAGAIKALPVLYKRYERSFDSYQADIYRT